MFPFCSWFVHPQIHLNNGIEFGVCSFLYNRDLVAELPFILMHPKPEEEEINPILADRSPGKQSPCQRNEDANSSQVTTGNLIQLDGYKSFCFWLIFHFRINDTQIFYWPDWKCIFRFSYSDDDNKDDDIIFEDFARLRLKGETEA